MRHVIITGATGMIGLALINECLKKNYEVYAIARPGSKRISVLPQSEHLHILECDLNQLQSLPDMISVNCDVFYHFGWQHTGHSSVEKWAHDREQFYGNIQFQIDNIHDTVDAVCAAKKLGCRLFVGAGSQAEYGPMNLERISPESPANPRTPYGITKYAAGKLARLEGEYLQIPCVWVRIFSVYGYNDKKTMLMGSVIDQMRRGEHLRMTAGVQQWDYLFCADAGRAFRLIGEKCKSSAVYCLGSGTKRPLREYIDFLAKELDYKLDIGYGEIPYQPESVMNLCADISTLTEDTGFVPEIPFEEGAKLLIQESLKQHEKLPDHNYHVIPAGG